MSAPQRKDTMFRSRAPDLGGKNFAINRRPRSSAGVQIRHLSCARLGTHGNFPAPAARSPASFARGRCRPALRPHAFFARKECKAGRPVRERSRLSCRAWPPVPPRRFAATTEHADEVMHRLPMRQASVGRRVPVVRQFLGLQQAHFAAFGFENSRLGQAAQRSCSSPC